MKFLNYKYREEPSIIELKFRDYRNYLLKNRHLFPEPTFQFAIADWHYNMQESRCPHDAWVKSLQIFEKASATSIRKRNLQIHLKLLGAYHDGEINIYYENVRSYNFTLKADGFDLKSHGDWLIDEITLTDKNYLIHEIEFSLSGEWQIECEKIIYEWQPFKSE